MKDRILVIDVETIGLHGPAFCVGFVVMDFYGEVTNEGLYAIRPDSILTDNVLGMKWAMENVQIEERHFNCSSLEELRSRFWKFWLEVRWRAIMAADVNWPCEANFLSDCIKENIGSEWHGPYPLLDIASFRMGAGDADTMKTEIRLPNEQPPHNPLCDARQSARQLAATIKNSIRAVNIFNDL